MADLLLELFSEEIPAWMQKQALTDLTSALSNVLNALGFSVADPHNLVSFVTPRRLAVIISNLPIQQADAFGELKGPKVGAPEAAMQGFLKKTGMTLDQLEEREGIYYATIHQKGKPTAEVLKSLIEQILVTFPWPKSMRWGTGEQAWVRPLHSILCIFDGKIVPVEFAGIKAGNTTKGHRFLAPQEITISNANEYETALAKAYVIADRDGRKAEIVKQATDLSSTGNWQLTTENALLEEVVGLVEWPVVLVGTIDKNYMDLPKEVLVSEMRAHQKYFALENKDGSFSDKFLITSNMTATDGGKAIIAGNERVLRARLSDGRFFWDTDRKKKLADWAKGLETVTYHAKLGTVADKVTRITALALQLAEYAKADKTFVERAGKLCKADLVTGMVGEFPELQGVMGRYYALEQGEKPEVADAIRDHYKPQGPADSVPNAPVSVCVALADKLDTLISMFAIGEKPTGSKDPFALRRAALGVIRIVLENNIRLPLKALLAAAPMRDIALHKAHEKLVKQTEATLNDPDIASHKVGKYLTVNESACEDIPEGAAENLAQALLAFFHDRLIVQLKDSGIRHDVIKAVIANGDDDLVRIVARAKAVQAFLDTDDGKNLLAGYKRAANILSIEEKKDKTNYNAAVDIMALKEKEEGDLANALTQAFASVQADVKTESFEGAMRSLSTLRIPVDHFFDKIMVNCDDKNLRANRLRLLASIRSSMDTIANFAVIEG